MKKRYLKIMVLFLLALIIGVQLTGCDQSKKYKGRWSGADEYGNPVDIEINDETLKLFQDNQLTEHPYKIKDVHGIEKENKDEIYGDSLVVNDNGTRIMLGENKKEGNNTLTMAFSIDDGNNIRLVNSLVKQDKGMSLIAESGKDAKDTKLILLSAVIVMGTAIILYRKKYTEGSN